MLILVNKVPPDLETRALKGHLERTFDMSVAALFPLNFEVVQLASSGLFSLGYPEHAFTRQIEAAADQIMNRDEAEETI